MRIALVGRTISCAATAENTAAARLALLAIHWGCWRIPELRALTNRKEVDILDFLGLQKTRPSGHE